MQLLRSRASSLCAPWSVCSGSTKCARKGSVHWGMIYKERSNVSFALCAACWLCSLNHSSLCSASVRFTCVLTHAWCHLSVPLISGSSGQVVWLGMLFCISVYRQGMCSFVCTRKVSHLCIAPFELDMPVFFSVLSQCQTFLLAVKQIPVVASLGVVT